ncbi:hypothetical protein H4R19_000875 [Coemansia spiralis]|nr:hypothetical protein H4R19_000875 [Coemansia spiralis]
MAATNGGRSRAQAPVISTVDEHDASRARKRAASHSQSHGHGHNHDHSHGHECRSHAEPPPTRGQDRAKQHRPVGGARKTAACVRQFARVILGDSESRSIFMFLILNLSYMFVQIVYGYITNSLGLISDAIHMLFDCMALAIGLVAAVMSKWPSDESFTFGYGRIETLSGFANGVFLMLISVSIFFEAIERLVHPPAMSTQRLLLVSFGGLVVNLFGMLAFNGHHHHYHGGSCGHSHKEDGGHSHGHHHRSQNMQGVFLHVMADTLGSVGVIVSTLLIQQFGWTGFDPLASIAIAGLIFASVVPLVRDSMHMLLLRLPDHSQLEVREAVAQITEQTSGISRPVKARFWPVTEAQIMGIVHVHVDLDQASSGDEAPQCVMTLRERIARNISSTVQARVSGLQDVFVHVDVGNS